VSGDKTVTPAELRRGLESLGVQLDDAQAERLTARFDLQGDGRRETGDCTTSSSSSFIACPPHAPINSEIIFERKHSITSFIQNTILTVNLIAAASEEEQGS